jgi:GH24 family phage-related lysozyme (muramidase)
MSFDGTGGRGPSLQDLFGFLRGAGVSGPDPNGDLIAQAQADIARRARLPKTGGLFGRDYAQFMADNAPTVPTASLDPMLFAAPIQAGDRPTGGEYTLNKADSAPQAAAGGQQFDAMGLPINAQVGEVALDRDGNQQRYLGHNQGDTRVWGGVDTTNTDPDTDAAVPELTVVAPRPPSPSAVGLIPSQADSRARQLDALTSYLSRDDVEGVRDYVYPDSRKRPTVGVGHLVRPEDHLKLGDKLDDERGHRRIHEFLRKDAAEALDAARAQAAEAGITDPNFIVALGSVNFQLGPKWNAGKNGHKKTWALIRQGDYAAAAREAANSDWNKQTPRRVRQFQSALHKLPPKPIGTR